MNAELLPRPLGEAADEAIAELRGIFGTRISFAETVCEQHSGLEGHHQGAWPEAVVYAETTQDVAKLAAWCHQRRIPLIAHGAGTSLEGNLAAVRGGIALDLSAMANIVEVNADSLFCTVEAGVTREALNQELRHSGLFFPIDPGANATLGGMSATRASGTNAVRYGTMRNNVLSLKVVLADGTIIDTGTRAPKSSAGYDLTALFVGSEGTLGIITEVTVRLHGLPDMVVAGTCAFESLEGAVRAVIAGLQCGIPFARIELLDSRQIAACNAYSGLDLVELPTLFFEFHGTQQSISEQVELFKAIGEEHGVSSLDVADRAEDRSKLWKARHTAYFATKAMVPNAKMWSTDVCVPIGKLAESILETQADLARLGVLATIVGHVGDGNYHVLFPIGEADPEAFGKARTVNDRMVERAIALGGTCTGEHGIGLGKRTALVLEHGSAAVSLMASIKKVMDPHSVLNPGKIFPD